MVNTASWLVEKSALLGQDPADTNDHASKEPCQAHHLPIPCVSRRLGTAVGSWGSQWCGAVGRLCLFDAVPYLPDELIDALGGYSELSSRFASTDVWFEKAEAL